MSQRASETFRVLGLRLGLDEPEARLRERALRRAGVDEADLLGLRIAHKSLDARRRGRDRSLHFVVHVDLMLPAGHGRRAGEVFERALRAGRIVPREPPAKLRVERPHPSMRRARVAVVGSGPAGLFGALTLARSGVGVDLLERGPSLHERSRALARFLHTRELDPEGNLLYGEGGAGTYSDGKIYTRVDHPLEVPLLEELVACGAQPEVLYDARAHIGTDRLHRILPRLRARLEESGVRLHWRTRLEALVCDAREPERVCALRTSRGELPCDAVLLALGQSARDSLGALAAQGLALEARAFQLGVRIEHPQALIDRARYESAPEARPLGAADYRLVARASGSLPAAHSFCMCPGGQIVPSVCEPGLLCTNGMSNSRHSSAFASAALVTTLSPPARGADPWWGVREQRRLEGLFFEAGGGNWAAPAQRACDFLAERDSSTLPHSSYKFGLCPARIDCLLPERVRDALRNALIRFERSIPGYAGPEGLLVGVESRSSSALRLLRDAESFRARGFANVYPIGEGSGYAGGIMSSAIDAARCAQAILQQGLTR